MTTLPIVHLLQDIQDLFQFFDDPKDNSGTRGQDRYGL